MSEYGIQHGQRHGPRGSDPNYTDVWHNVGDSGEPPFLAGSNASPTVDIPNPVPLRFRLSVGPPNDCDYDWTTTPATATSINRYTEHQVEIQGDVTGLVAGDIVFMLPLEYTHEYDVPFHTHDDLGGYVPCRLLSTGEFIWGVP